MAEFGDIQDQDFGDIQGGSFGDIQSGSIPTGGLVITGYAVITTSILYIQAGVIDVTGLAPDVLLAPVIDVPIANITITGSIPDLLLSVAAYPSPTGISLAGLAPEVLMPQILSIPVSVMSLSGLAPVAIDADDVTINIPRAALNLVGLVPAAGESLVVPVPSIGMDVTGSVPYLIASGNKVVSPTIGTILVGGFSPELDRGSVTVPSLAGIIGLYGSIPAIINTGSVWTVYPNTQGLWADQNNVTTIWDLKRAG
jgi:hypothetical protein